MADRDRTYAETVLQLLRLPAAEDIRAAARELRNVRGSMLRDAFDAREEFLRAQNRSAELDLLSFVRQIFMVERGDADTTVREEDIRDTATLMEAALQRPNALRARALLATHMDLLDPDDVYWFAASAVRPHAPRQELAPRVNTAHLAALLLRDPELLVRTYLLRSGNARQQQDYLRAARMLRRAEAVARERPEDLKLVLGAQAGLYRSMRRFGDALVALGKTREQFVHAGEALLVASTDEAIAGCQEEVGDYDAAIEAYTAAAETFEQRGLADGLIRILNRRGLAFDSMGYYDRGLADYSRAAEVAKEVGDHDQEFIARNNAAATFLKRGRPREAYEQFTRILHTLERGANTAKIASTYNNLGQALLELDQPNAASSMFGRALSLKINRGDPSGEVIAFLGLGDAAKMKGEADVAKTFYALAMVPVLESGNAGSLTLWATRVADQDGGETDESIQTLLWAANQTRAAHERTPHLVTASALFNIYVNRGEDEKALEIYKGAVEEFRRDGADPLIERLDAAYAHLLVRRGECAEALSLLEEPRRNVDEALTDIADAERYSEIISERIPVYGALIAALTGCGNSDDPAWSRAAFDAHESAKAPAFLAGLAAIPAAAPEAVPVELAAQEAELLAREQSFRDAEIGSLPRRAEQLRKTRADLEQCWTAMAPFAPDYVRYRTGKPYSFAEITGRLVRSAPGMVFVSLFCDAVATTAFVFRGGDPYPRAIRCAVTADEWESVAKRLRRAFNGAVDEFPPYPPIRRDHPEKRSLDFFHEAGARLNELFDAVAGAPLVCIAPHGPLHLIPFHAFRMTSGEYLVERCAIVYSASMSVAVNTIANECSLPRRPSAYVAAVASAQDRDPAAFTRDVEIFDGLACDLTEHVGVKAATRRNVLAELPRHDVVHLSCHGFFNPRDPRKSGLLVSNGKAMPPRNPWACPPFERREHMITAADLLEVTLSAELVTLNACSTALQGQRNAGDELDGFTRSLLLAGAASIVVGLWNIDQRSSREFLSLFYRVWLDPSRRCEKWDALHQAQLSFIHRDEEPALRHPYHWAPFILTGDWR